MKRAFAGAGLFVLFAFTIAACVGDDPNPVTSDREPDPNVAVGREGGACTEDKQCLGGLECVRGKICLPPEDGGTSTTDGGGGNDASSDATSSGDDAESGGPNTCAAHSGASSTEVLCVNVFCSGGPAPSQPCCLQDTGYPSCMPGCAYKKIACDSVDECAGQHCCLALNTTITEAMLCSSGVDYAAFSNTHCGTCTPAELRVCRNDDDCVGLAGSPKCSTIELRNASVKMPLGVCL